MNEQQFTQVLGSCFITFSPEEPYACERKWPLILFLQGAGKAGSDLVPVVRLAEKEVMVKALKKAGGAVRFTSIPRAGMTYGSKPTTMRRFISGFWSIGALIGRAAGKRRRSGI